MAIRYALIIMVLSVIDTLIFDATCIENWNHVIDEPLSLKTVKYKLLTCNEYQHTLITRSSSVIMCAEIAQRNKNNNTH
jgi:hypothetical protein